MLWAVSVSAYETIHAQTPRSDLPPWAVDSKAPNCRAAGWTVDLGCDNVRPVTDDSFDITGERS